MINALVAVFLLASLLITMYILSQRERKAPAVTTEPTYPITIIDNNPPGFAVDDELVDIESGRPGGKILQIKRGESTKYLEEHISGGRDWHDGPVNSPNFKIIEAETTYWYTFLIEFEDKTRTWVSAYDLNPYEKK